MAVTDLITLVEAREFLQKTDAQVAADNVLEDLILRASLEIQREIDLRVAPPESGDKTLDWDGSRRIRLTPYVARTITAVTLDPGESGVTVLTTAQFRLGPEPALDSVYPWVEFDARALGSYGGAFSTRRVLLTGEWGFTDVPEELKQACCLTVAAWYRGRVAAFSSQYEDADGGFVARVQKLPFDAFQILEKWRRYEV